MRLWVFVILAAIVTCDAAVKKRKKFEGDFEFADDTADNAKRDGEKKTWIFDPDSELCQALKCRKEERCLLENAYTAVCVSRAEIRKNGDVVIPKSESRTSTSRSLEDDEDDEIDEDDYDDEDEDVQDSGIGGAGDFSINLNEENNVDGDLGLEFYDLDSGDDSIKKMKETTSTTSTTTSTTTTPRSAVLKRCNPCPVIKPTYVCGTDNNTYSSLCKIDYYNCMHDSSVRMACKGFCPCPTTAEVKKEKQAMRLSHFENKYKASVNKAGTLKPTVIFSPEVAKFKKEIFGKKALKATSKSAAVLMDLSTDKQRQRGYNDVLPEKKDTAPITECSESGLSAMGNRLLDWFSVLMSQGGREKPIKNASKAHFPSSCAREVKWMFGYLDSNTDAQLSMKELYDLEHNDRENCLKPFLDKCDYNRDIFVTSAEWCRCFEKADRPCVAMKRRSKPGLLGAYKPSCDVEGFFQPTQCHTAVGTCWCVDKHGVEQNGSRSRGKPDCEGILSKNGLMKDVLTNENDEDDSENRLDDSDELEGSGDY